MKKNQISALVLQTNPLSAKLLALALQGHGLKVVAVASAADAEKEFRAADFDLLITDLYVTAESQSVETIQKLVMLANQTSRVVYFSSVPEPRIIGVTNSQIPRGVPYVSANKKTAFEDLLAATSAVLGGRSISQWRSHLEPRHALSNLSRSQMSVLRLMAQGASNAEIARQRETTIRAVENLIKRTISVLGLPAHQNQNSRVSAVREYFRVLGSSIPHIEE